MTGPLVDAAWLAERIDDPALRIADTRWYLGDGERGRRAYAEGHIPGAIYVDLERHLSAASGPGRHPLPTPEEFAATMGSLGIGDEHRVVAYDDQGGAVAARLWWMLRHVGHRAVAVLDGGLDAWVSAGGPLTSRAPDHPPATLTPRPVPGEVLDRDQVRDALGDIVLLDARSPARYRGDEEPIDPVAGHIPSARSADYEGNLRRDGRFLAPDALAARYRRLGAVPGTVVYCGSGVTACHDLLAMEVAGIPGGRLYAGSWSDWSAAGYPVAVGDDPGSPPG